MSRSVKSLDEIRESRILFDKNPPAFGYILITVVAVFSYCGSSMEYKNHQRCIPYRHRAL